MSSSAYSFSSPTSVSEKIEALQTPLSETWSVPQPPSPPSPPWIQFAPSWIFPPLGAALLAPFFYFIPDKPATEPPPPRYSLQSILETNPTGSFHVLVQSLTATTAGIISNARSGGATVQVVAEIFPEGFSAYQSASGSTANEGVLVDGVVWYGLIAE